MRILRPNFFNTTTQLSIPATGGGGTATIANLYDKDHTTQFLSDLAGTDVSACSWTLVFADSITVSEIALRNINVKNYNVTYNGANAFSPAVSLATNSQTSRYYTVNTVSNITSITVTLTSTITLNQQKRVGELIISNLLYNFASDRLPSSDDYKPSVNKKQIVHEMSDGGVSVFNIRDKFAATIDMGFVPTSTETQLRTIYDNAEAVVFVPFDTGTGWDGNLAEVAWIGNYEFLELEVSNGYRGRIQLKQTAGGRY